jgi:26S proteasome non-ATPase regulatory subunit 5
VILIESIESQLLIDLCRHSADALQLISSRGLFNQMLVELQGDDVLGKLNCLELLGRLTDSAFGFAFLEEHGIVDKVQLMLQDSDPLMSLLLPGIITFLGQTAARKPENLNMQYQPFINVVFDSLEGGDATLKSVSVETLGVIGSSVEGKIALHKQGD